MTGAQFKAIFIKYTSPIVSDADIIIFANMAKDDLAPAIQEKDTRVFEVPGVDDLVADQREYPLDDTAFSKIRNIEFDLSNSGVYVPSVAMDYRGSSTESKIVSQFSNSEPRHYITRNGLFILSGAITAVTSGIKYIFNQYPEDLATASLALSTDLAIPTANNKAAMPRGIHEIWCRRAAIMWKLSQPRGNKLLTALDQAYENDKENILDTLSPIDLDDELIADSVDVSGSDNGYDY